LRIRVTKLFPCLERLWDQRIIPENEFYDSDEGEGDDINGQKKSMNEQSYASEASGEKMNGSSLQTDNKETKQVRVSITEEEEMELTAALDEGKAPANIESPPNTDHVSTIPTTNEQANETVTALPTNPTDSTSNTEAASESIPSVTVSTPTEQDGHNPEPMDTN
jgi:histone deacetylase 1/2